MSYNNPVTPSEQFFSEVFAKTGKSHRIYSALGKRPMIWGCDRELFIFNAMLSVGVIVLTFNFVASFMSLSLGLIVFFLLAKMGQADPMMRYVYLRQLRYKRYYLGHGQLRTLPSKNYRGVMGMLKN